MARPTITDKNSRTILTTLPNQIPSTTTLETKTRRTTAAYCQIYTTKQRNLYSPEKETANTNKKV